MKEDILFITQEVRKNIENKTSKYLPSEIFSRFPIGCCSASSFVLAEIINMRLGTNAKVLSYDKGQYGLPDSHAWVEVDGVCIDITIDQFNLGSGTGIHIGEHLSIHKEYMAGDRCDLTRPKWLDTVVDHLDKCIPNN